MRVPTGSGGDRRVRRPAHHHPAGTTGRCPGRGHRGTDGDARLPPPTPEIDALYDALNSAIAATTRTHIADVRPVFNPDDPAARAAAICHNTLTCATNGADSHPSDAGYQAIADSFAAVTRCPPPGRRP